MDNEIISPLYFEEIHNGTHNAPENHSSGYKESNTDVNDIVNVNEDYSYCITMDNEIISPLYFEEIHNEIHDNGISNVPENHSSDYKKVIRMMR